MKKILAVLVFVLVLALSISVFADYQTVVVYVNGELLVSDSPAVLVNSRTMVPLRAISEKLGCDVGWDDKTQTAEIKNEKTAVYVTIDSDIMVKKDIKADKSEEIKIDAPAMLYKQRTLIPLRAVSEALDAKVDWDAEKECALITTQTIETFYGKVTADGYEFKDNSIKFVAPDGVEMVGYNDDIEVSDWATDVETVDQETIVEFGAYYIQYAANISVAVSPETSITPEEYLEYVKDVQNNEQDGYTYTALEGMKDVKISDIQFKKLVFVAENDKNKVNMDYYAGKVGNRILAAVVLYADEAKAKAEELINAFEIANNQKAIFKNTAIPTELTSLSDVENYLNTKYPYITIKDETYPIKYTVQGNSSNYIQWDMCINPTIGVVNEVLSPVISNSSTVSREEKQAIVDSIYAFMEPLAKDIISQLPDQKILGTFDLSYYKYPNIKVDYVVRTYFSWSNFSYNLLKKNSDTEIGEFRWLYKYDTKTFDFHNYYDIESNAPVEIKSTFDHFVVKSLKYKDSSSVSSDGTKINVKYEAVVSDSGFAYLHFYDENGKYLGNEYKLFYKTITDYDGMWPIETKKIIVSADEIIPTENELYLKQEYDVTSNVPFAVTAEYSIEDDFEIIDCYMVDKREVPALSLDGCYTCEFVIEVISDKYMYGINYVYVNFFDENWNYIESHYTSIKNGKNKYNFFNIAGDVAHIEFSKDRQTSI